MERGGFVYIITNTHNTTLYIGVTSDLEGRIWEHINKIHLKSFSAKYNLDKLVYFEFFSTIEEAIEEEKRIKGGSRKRKRNLFIPRIQIGSIYTPTC